MNATELYQFIQHVKPSWVQDDTCLEGRANLDEALLKQLEDAERAGFLNQVITLQGERKARGVDQVIPNLHFGKEVTFKFVTNNDGLLIFPSMNALVKKRPVTPPKAFAIYCEDGEIHFYDSQDEKPELTGEIKHYLEVANIWRVLKDCCDHSGSAAEMTFLYRKKLTLRSSYDSRVLEREFDGFERFTRILKDLSNDVHKEGKAHILQNTLVSILGLVPEKERFEYLLLNFTKFTSKFDDAYHAYVVGFSFDDLRKEHEERYREYMVKINEVVSSSLTKALMIPGALYLTATRTQSIQSSKSLANAMEVVVVNVGIGLAAVAICMVYWWILCNEESSLASIKVEYQSLMGRLKDKSIDAYEAIEEYIEVLDSKIKNAESALRMLTVINVLSGCVSILWVLCRFFVS